MGENLSFKELSFSYAGEKRVVDEKQPLLFTGSQGKTRRQEIVSNWMKEFDFVGEPTQLLRNIRNKSNYCDFLLRKRNEFLDKGLDGEVEWSEYLKSIDPKVNVEIFDCLFARFQVEASRTHEEKARKAQGYSIDGKKKQSLNKSLRKLNRRILFLSVLLLLLVSARLVIQMVTSGANDFYLKKYDDQEVLTLIVFGVFAISPAIVVFVLVSSDVVLLYQWIKITHNLKTKADLDKPTSGKLQSLKRDFVIIAIFAVVVVVTSTCLNLIFENPFWPIGTELFGKNYGIVISLSWDGLMSLLVIIEVILFLQHKTEAFLPEKIWMICEMPLN